MVKTKQQVYHEVITYVKEKMCQIEKVSSQKHLYYISAEFLIGKMLKSNLIALGYFDEVKQMVEQQGYTMEDMEEFEQEPSLGNGGLGRLAACYLDSIANLNLPGDGIGLYYHFGLFRQRFEDNKQTEYPDPWISKDSWFTRTNHQYNVKFKDFEAVSVMYEMDVVGMHGKKNTLRLFDIETVDESVVKKGIAFDKKDILKNLTLFLYPDDSDEAGRLLRIYQQYFMVSSGAQYIIEDCKKKGYELFQLYDHVVIQINDTHPTLVIPELIRLLMQEGIVMKQAIDIVRRTCCYTNHTILAEALETWPRAYLKEVVPDLMVIIEALDALVDDEFHEEHVSIIDRDDRVHMAHIDIHYGKSVNGVAAIHTGILKHTELQPFYRIYPDKFSNKTNGITFRRFLYSANEELYEFLKETLGERAVSQNDFHSLMMYQDDKAILKKLRAIKQMKKRQLCAYMEKTQGIVINSEAIFDIQIKRLHEYKRQQMNALSIIHTYLEVKKGIYPPKPITYIFGAKAAPAYTIAKDIIHLLLCLQQLIKQDAAANAHMQICFVENYNVSKAEKLIPACDISQQISLASKEASGTGNMKLMLNGAITLGTRDGANVEIEELVGRDNIYIFGESSDDIIAHYQNKDYSSNVIYEQDEEIKEMVDFIIGDELTAIGDKIQLTRLYQELLQKDWFMTLLDLQAYITCRKQAYQDYMNTEAWTKKALVNIAKSSYFSSDRAIQEYNEDIWRL